MLDKLPLWAYLVRWLGLRWTVEQDWEVVYKDHQGCVRLWANGNPRRIDAEKMVDKTPTGIGWVRRSITVWKD